MAKKDSQQPFPEPTWCPPPYVDPLEALEHHIKEVSIQTYGLLKNIRYDRENRFAHQEETQRAIGLALAAAEGIGQHLKYGLGDRAGSFETEVRTTLTTLNKYTPMARALVDGDEQFNEDRSTWSRNVDRLGQLLIDLRNTARIHDAEVERQFFRLLIDYRDALADLLENGWRPFHGFAETLLAGNEAQGAEPTQGQQDTPQAFRELDETLHGSLIPSVESTAEPVVPQLLCMLIIDGHVDTEIDLLPKQLDRAMVEVWRRLSPDPGTSDAEQKRATVATRKAIDELGGKVDWLVDWLDGLLDAAEKAYGAGAESDNNLEQQDNEEQAEPSGSSPLDTLHKPGGVDAAEKPDRRQHTTETHLKRLREFPAEARLSPRDLAVALGLDTERLRKRLERYRAKHLDCFIEVAESERKPREPRYLYVVSEVRDLLEELIRASGETSGERPAK